MKDLLQARLHAVSDHSSLDLVQGAHRGLEKESLRITPDGYIAATPHTEVFGSALTNRFITTDYSEALLEMVTPPLETSEHVLGFLDDIHRFIYSGLDDELLWAFSMPCMVRSEADIPIARYGTSNVGRMKTVYRRGLGYRYGRYMQAIAGIHFNWSVPETFWPAFAHAERSDSPDQLRSDAYLALVRNVRRTGWLLYYLFGASPAVCKSFLAGRQTYLKELDTGTVYGPWATSLRMSDLGYHNDNQASIRVSADSVDAYIHDLDSAIRTPHKPYEDIGVRVDGDYRQLNANLLQIENEYYSTVRPKRVARSGERPTMALRRGGVEYVELRALDLSPFHPQGIGLQEIRFLEAFLAFCMLAESPPMDRGEMDECEENHRRVATEGRKPGLELIQAGSLRGLKDWALELCEGILQVSAIMDAESGDYSAAVKAHRDLVEASELTPSARIIESLRSSGQSFFPYAMQVSRSYQDHYLSTPPHSEATMDSIQAESGVSLRRQKEIEDQDQGDFAEYISRWVS